jgi:hypothetical protein
VAGKGDSDIEKIQKLEETQEALRKSIDDAKRLAEEADRLLKEHKKDLDDKGA